MKPLRVLDIVEGTSVDGPGLRTSIYFAGCSHGCPGCHNPQSWSANGGEERTLEEIMQVVEYNDFDVTFSGGDPFFQYEGVAALAKEIKTRLGKNIWCYTGYVWEQLVSKPEFMPLLRQLDVVVDGRFVQVRRNIDLRFRGSDNQRFIDVKASLQHPNLAPVEFDL